jgi:hypothetical protein
MLKNIWQFLQDEKNQKVLGGVALVIGALWTAYVYFFPAPEARPPPATTIFEQKGAGIASGRDTNINAPVTINPDTKEVVAPINERLEKLAAQVAREKGVEATPLQTVLVKLGEAGGA